MPSDLVDQRCLHAFSGNTLVGTSPLIVVVKITVQKRARTVLGDISDTEGPWFNKVEYLKEKEPEMLFVAQSKAKTVGIIGAGVSGLMTSVSFCQPSVSQDLTICDSYFSRVQVSITGESLKHPIVLVGEFVPHTSTVPGRTEVAENALLTINTGGSIQQCLMKATTNAKDAYNDWLGWTNTKWSRLRRISLLHTDKLLMKACSISPSLDTYDTD